MGSGFVPFLQIHDNSHKRLIEFSPDDARLTIFYLSESARKTALDALQHELDGLAFEHEACLAMKIFLDDSYVESGHFGIDMPEVVMRETYIMRPDLSFLAGWETGRSSEPAFMNMNLHTLREGAKPRVVLYQYDEDCMNPHGLLIAYAEAAVKPVVSDFDTFTVGSRNMPYEKV